MARVSILGTGMMGTALCRALLSGGHEVTVFDLDEKKMEPLVRAGAIAASSGLGLAENAEILIPSLPTYGGLRGFLAQDGVMNALKGATIVQLSSGAPETVEEFLKFIDGTGIDYLEGRIKNYPKDIGKNGSRIIFSGDEAIFERVKPVLAALAHHLEYLGPNHKTVSVLDESVVIASYGQFWGLMLAGSLCKAHGVSPMTLLELLKDTTQLNMDDIEEVGYPDLVAGAFRENVDTATITAWTEAADQTITAISAAGLDTTVFQSIHDLLKQVESAGLSRRGIYAIATAMHE